MVEICSLEVLIFKSCIWFAAPSLTRIPQLRVSSHRPLGVANEPVILTNNTLGSTTYDKKKHEAFQGYFYVIDF